MLLQLMTKFAPMLDHDVTKRVFLTRFAQLCNDALFHVRKVIERIITSAKFLRLKLICLV